MGRIIDIAESPAKLRIDQGRLCIQASGQSEVFIPFDDLSAVVVSHPQVSFTHAVLTALAEHNSIFVVCDNQHLPAGMLLGLQNHHLQTQQFPLQAQASKPLQKRLWQQLVKAKIASQARLLLDISDSDHGLNYLITQVRSGDPTNVEAQAARRYWKHLFGTSFRRNFDALDQNRHLNYGYAILRGIVARAVCGAGLHPSLGIHHHHRNNSFALADDLLEPFRPVVDRAVWTWEQENDPRAPFDRDAKLHLLEYLNAYYKTGTDCRTLFDIAARLATSLARAFSGESKHLILPTPLGDPAESAEARPEGA
jgi:CRISPR-associated protein Cas1